MKPISCVFSCLLLLALTSFGYSQSLADLAKKEKERRQAVKTEGKVITNNEAAKYQGAAVTTGTPPPAPPADKAAAEKTGAAAEKAAGGEEAKGEGGSGSVKEKSAVDEPVDFQGRTESYWRQTFADARQRVRDLENEANVLILKANDLQNRFYRENDGYKQQQIQREIQKTIFEQDVNKEVLAKAKAILVDLEMEARKSGALPGWIR